MYTEEKPVMNRCNKLHELPPVVTVWQQKAWRPDCNYYECGLCSNPMSRDSSGACPFDGKVLPLREVTFEAPKDQPKKPLDAELCEVLASQPRSKALEQVIKDRIVNRTGGRIRVLAIELSNRELFVRGNAPCYYVKQLALQGVLDVLDSDHQSKLECNFQIVVHPPSPTEPTAPAGGRSPGPEPT